MGIEAVYRVFRSDTIDMCTNAIGDRDDERLSHALTRLGVPAPVQQLLVCALGSNANISVAARLHLWYLLRPYVGARTPWSCVRLVAWSLARTALLIFGVLWVCERLGKGYF